VRPRKQAHPLSHIQYGARGGMSEQSKPDWLALRRKISVREAAELNDFSEDTFRRRYPHLIKKVSPRRDAVELGDALSIGKSKT
jgi:hypothetical protein